MMTFQEQITDLAAELEEILELPTNYDENIRRL